MLKHNFKLIIDPKNSIRVLKSSNNNTLKQHKEYEFSNKIKPEIENKRKLIYQENINNFRTNKTLINYRKICK